MSNATKRVNFSQFTRLKATITEKLNLTLWTRFPFFFSSRFPVLLIISWHFLVFNGKSVSNRFIISWPPPAALRYVLSIYYPTLSDSTVRRMAEGAAGELRCRDLKLHPSEIFLGRIEFSLSCMSLEAVGFCRVSPVLTDLSLPKLLQMCLM